MSLGRAESVQTFQRQISTDVPIIAIGMIDSVLSLLSVFFGDVDNSDYSINIIIIPVLLIIVIISIYIELYTFCHHCWKDLAVAGAISKHCCDVMLWRFPGSANGNSIPEDALHEPELLWPRWADRLEATGEIGIVRTLVAPIGRKSCFSWRQKLRDLVGDWQVRLLAVQLRSWGSIGAVRYTSTEVWGEMQS